MTSKEIESNVRQIFENFTEEEFIFNLLVACGISKTSVTRIKNGDFNLSKVEGEVLYKKKVFFKEAKPDKQYKLEADIHNLIFPMGFEIDEVNYESHNLWLLDERFATYKFIASDKPITAVSQKKSSQKPDLMMFDNPISYGDANAGEISSMVIFEFKRPGDVAHQKKKTDYRWEFSELVEKYFGDFLYTQDKKNYKGKQVVVRKNTPKFGYVILDVIPQLLEDYNKDRGWHKTPFDSYYKMIDGLNYILR
ncbi:MAG: hypothetical protein LBR26_01420 [Prevotella sp.]|jgi:hypothetical protein|nr:hypothetical protein [Prevotella sp.]